MNKLSGTLGSLKIEASGMSIFTTTELCKVVEVGRPAFQTWMEYLSPSIKSPAGQGDSARWSFGDLVIAKTFQTLIKSGVSRNTASYCAKYIGPFYDFTSEMQIAESVWFDIFLGDNGKFIASNIIVDPPPAKVGHTQKTRHDYDGCKVVVSVNLSKVVDEVKRGVAAL